VRKITEVETICPYCGNISTVENSVPGEDGELLCSNCLMEIVPLPTKQEKQELEND